MNNETIDYDSISRIKVDGTDSKISNQDARTTYISADGSEFKRSSDLMLGNDNKNLDDGTYVSVDEFVAAAQALFTEQKVKKIKMIKTGKKLKPDQLAKVVAAAQEACRIVVNSNAKVQNQDARSISVKAPNMSQEKVVAGAFLGKNGIPLSNGNYVNQEEVEFTITKKKKVVAPIPTKIKLAKGLGTLAVTAGLVALIPFIMHANSVMWHHVGPNAQEFLHTINLGLGKLVNFSYDGHGLWTTAKGVFMNADAPTANLLPEILTYGATGAGIAKLVADIKNGIVNVADLIKGKGKEKEEQEGKTL